MKVIALRVWQAASHASTLQSVFQWTGLGKPALSVLITVIAAIGGVGKIHFSYLLASVTVVFASCMHAINRLDEWRVRHDLRHRLTFIELTSSTRVNIDDFRNSSIQIGLKLRNKAFMPINYRVDAMSVAVDNKTNMHPNVLNRSGLLVPEEDVIHSFDWIDGVDVTKSLAVGYLEYSVSFGPTPSRLVFTKSQRMQFTLEKQNKDEVGYSFIRWLFLESPPSD